MVPAAVANERFALLRDSIRRGPTRTAAAGRPAFSLDAWCRAAGVSRTVLRGDNPHAKTLDAMAAGAAAMLGWDQAQMKAWLLEGEPDSALETFLSRLPTLKRCDECLGWRPKAQICRLVGRCKDCSAARLRSLGKPREVA